LYVSLPLINLFINPHALDPRRFSQAVQTLGIPSNFPLNPASYNGDSFAEINQSIKSLLKPTRTADSSAGGHGDTYGAGYNQRKVSGNLVVDTYVSGQYVTISIAEATNFNRSQGYQYIDLSTAYDSGESSFDSDGSYQGYSNDSYNSNSNMSSVGISLWDEISPELKQAVPILYGIKWKMIYASKNSNKAYTYYEYTTKLREGYSNDFYPSTEYDSKSSLESKFRDTSVEYGSTKGLNTNDPFYNSAEGLPFVKTYGSMRSDNVVSSRHFTVDSSDYEKIFLNQVEWEAINGHQDNSVNDGYKSLVNLFQGSQKYLMNNFPFKDFDMENF